MSSPSRYPHQYFYPRPPRGGRPTPSKNTSCKGYFYPRPPRGGRLGLSALQLIPRIFLSTPSARRATEATRRAYCITASISIHALREEGDCLGFRSHVLIANFYPRPPRGGRRRPCLSASRPATFLSTPSARRATGRLGLWSRPALYFYPRPPRGGRQQIRLPRTLMPGYFYPRPPRGGRQKAAEAARAEASISIHALREEGDAGRDTRQLPTKYFYPRPPRGGRHADHDNGDHAGNISIHALREEGDRGSPLSASFTAQFLSTPSARRATSDQPQPKIELKISIHALREEGDDWTRRTALPSTHFYPRPPRGGRLLHP